MTATSAVVPVELGDRSYDIHVGTGLLGQIGELANLPTTARRALVVTQDPVAPYAEQVAAALAAHGLDVTTETVPDGEVAKNADVLAELWSRCAQLPLGRGDVVVAVGGGVVGDLAGFLAASWNRGVALVQVPTTVLAMVDSAIGGKTGINLAEGKNLVGAFHQPRAVLADVDVLATLDQRQVVAGLGEVVKYGFIRDPHILDLLADDPDRARSADPELLLELVRRSAVVKAAVVSGDERESGERAHLNFGHTHGHAVEALTGYTEVLHGEAITIGMATALRIGVHEGRTPVELCGRLDDVAEALGLPHRAPRLDRTAVWETMARDKKAQDGLRWVLLDGLAEVVVTTADRAHVDAAIDEVEG